MQHRDNMIKCMVFKRVILVRFLLGEGGGEGAPETLKNDAKSRGTIYKSIVTLRLSIALLPWP